METNSYRIPLSVTVSRKTGQVTNIQWCDNATEEEFMRFFNWMKMAGKAALRAERGETEED